MKKLSSINGLKYITCILVVTQGLLLALLTTFFLNHQYINQLRNYPQNSYPLTLKSVPKDKTMPTLRYLQQASQDYDLLITKQDIALDSEGQLQGILLSIMGNTALPGTELTYLNQPIITKENLLQLQTSKEQESTLGFDISSHNVLQDLPYFKFGTNVSIKKLTTVIDNQQTINGFYHIVGLAESEQASFLTGLSEVTGVDQQLFDSRLSGMILDDSFKALIYIVFFVAHSLIFFALIFVLTIQSLKTLGIKMLLGWSKRTFIKQLYQPFILTGCMAMLVVILAGWYLTDFSFNTMLFFSTLLLVGVINILLTTLYCAVASLLVLVIKPINAIRERLSKRAIIVVTTVFYILSSVALMWMCQYIDGPYKAVENNLRIAKSWREVSHYHVIQTASVGLDQASFTHQSNQYNHDVYDWYQSIADKEGVYLFKSAYFSKAMLDEYQHLNVYQSVPTQPFWLFNMSPNYLAQAHINVSPNLVQQAQEGVRVYLLPDTLSPQEANLLKAMIQEKDIQPKKKEDIQTKFTENKQILFETYHNEQDIFTWTTESDLQQYITDPIIYITTPQNMMFFESESLSAIGLKNNYLKLTQPAVDKYVNQSYLAKYNLDDNHIVFTSVNEFINGLTKNLWLTIQWFGILIVAMTGIVIAMLYTTAILFKLVYRETITIKHFLGFSLFKIYRVFVIGLVIVCTSEIITMLLLRSKIGVVYFLFLTLLQFGIFYYVVAKNKISDIIYQIK